MTESDRPNFNYQALEPSEPIDPNRADYENVFLPWLRPKNAIGLELFAFIRQRLRQFHLETLYTDASVLNEVYVRACEHFRKGKSIHNPLAWTRSTAYNVIRERSREQRKFVPLTCEPIAPPPNLDNETEPLRCIAEAMQQLPSNDRRILIMKIVEGRSWEQIRETLLLEGGEVPSKAALRKQKQRLLERLRRLLEDQPPKES